MLDRGQSREHAERARFEWSLRRWLLTVSGVVTLIVVITGALFVHQGLKARSALVSAQSQAQQLQAHLTANDQKAARGSLKDLQRSTGDARSATSGVLWAVGSRAPFVGDDIKTVRTVSRVLDDVAADGLKPLVDVADQIDANAFSPKNGKIDLAGVETIAPALAEAERALTKGQAALRSIDPQSLVGPLQGPVGELLTKIDEAQATASAGETAANLLPGMLGGSDKRSYLLAFQNNAEIRSTGGLPGAFAILSADRGKLSIGGQGTAAEIGYFDPPVVKLTKDERDLYSNLMASFLSDTTFTPDFPRAAGIMRAMIKERTGTEVDGVISVDPVALSYILTGTGPVKLADGSSLTSTNAVRKLLNEVYLEFAAFPDKQDAYFADAAVRVFDAVAAGQGDPAGVLRGMSKAVRENRILIASSHGSEQDILVSTRIAGVLPRDSGSTPHIGLYLNDSTETKLEYYLRRETTADSIGCTRREAQQLSVTTTLTSKAPADASSLPDSILGPGTGEKPGSMRINLRYYAPYKGEVVALKVDGVAVTVNLGRHKGRQVAILPVLLAPGRKVTVVASITSGKHQPANAIFSTTPGMEATPNNVNVPSACQR